MDALNKLTPEQRQAVMMQAQKEANTQIMRDMINNMAQACFQKCAGTSVRTISFL
jgi:Tim10/DDP family zinc finger